VEEQKRLERGVIPLLSWYGENARVLPWRSQPTPYAVWVSEIMLQQTRVAAVLDYFRRFMEELPTISHLAQCPEERLMKLWQGLGYYSRARNLQKAAQVIQSEYGGEFPQDYDKIRALPGVGDYTAGAVSSIAFGQAQPAVDGNVLRVITRILAWEEDITKPATKRSIHALLAEIMPREAPGAFNQALMELGALVCLPNGAPLCDRCPVAQLCLAHQRQLTDTIPVKPPKKARRLEERTVFLIQHGGRIALRQRPKKGLLAGLWEFPNEEGNQLPLDQWGIVPLSLEPRGKGKHIFTHIEWHMTGLAVTARDDTLPQGWVWATPQELQEKYPIPNAFDAFRGAAEGLMAEGREAHDL
jgi:A/G-specific adenine glycosylase